jgi:hypothetical protein
MDHYPIDGSGQQPEEPEMRVENGQLSPPERRLLERWATAANTSVRLVRRYTTRPYDLHFEGVYVEGGRMPSGVTVSGWLPKACIRDLTRWTSPEIAVMTNYPEMVVEGDWSGVRDSDQNRIWAIFAQHVLEGA